MSKFATQLSKAAPSGSRTRRGPSNLCEALYKPDAEDAAAIEEFRRRIGESWATAQRKYDELIGITAPIPNDKFRYHWRFKCWCWPDDLRRP